MALSIVGGPVMDPRLFLNHDIDIGKIMKWVSPDNLIPFSTRVVFANIVTAFGWFITGEFMTYKKIDVSNVPTC